MTPRPKWPLWIEHQLVRRGIHDERVLGAIALVPRAAFVPVQEQGYAEDDAPLPIGCGQTISQPYIVALSLEALELKGGEHVLDIGTGSGYQAALLSYLAAEVHTVEVHRLLLDHAQASLEGHHRAPVHCHLGDGRLGWPAGAPYDAIVVGAWSEDIPQALVDQLAPGGRMVLPYGLEHNQLLVRFRKNQDGQLTQEVLEQVRFVPLVYGSPAPSVH